MTSLKELIHQSEIDKIERQKLKRDISSYINQKHVRKLIKKALRKRKCIYCQIDNKHFHLTPTYSFDTYNHICYELEIQDENNEIIAVIKINSLMISYKLSVKVDYFKQHKITHDQIMKYIKTIIGL